MKRKSHAIKELLGFSQDDLAQVLQLHRNTVSRFELGRGGIPLASRMLLAELLQYMTSAEAAAYQPKEVQQQQTACALTVFKQHRENDYQLERIRRKLAKSTATYTQAINALKALDFLEEHAQNTPKNAPEILGVMRRKIVRSLQQQGLGTLLELEVQLELLELEKILLDAELRKIGLKPYTTKDKE